jgi:plasmid stabilization system protein ParE
MRVRVTSPAEAELTDAAEWYDGQTPGVAGRFLAEYQRLLDRLGENPRQYPTLRGELRRAGFSRFPYGLIYRILPDEVEVISCFHGRRDPRRWQRRAQ